MPTSRISQRRSATTDAVARTARRFATDLALRWQEDQPLKEIDQATVYTDGAAGYTDYPELAPVS